MDATLSEIGKQVPALAVLVFVVIAFLKHMSARDQVILHLQTALENNTKVLHEVLALIHELRHEKAA